VIKYDGEQGEALPDRAVFGRMHLTQRENGELSTIHRIRILTMALMRNVSSTNWNHS